MDLQKLAERRQGRMEKMAQQTGRYGGAEGMLTAAIDLAGIGDFLRQWYQADTTGKRALVDQASAHLMKFQQAVPLVQKALQGIQGLRRHPADRPR